jgi:hypothetical protein
LREQRDEPGKQGCEILPLAHEFAVKLASPPFQSLATRRGVPDLDHQSLANHSTCQELGSNLRVRNMQSRQMSVQGILRLGEPGVLDTRVNHWLRSAP